MTQFKSIVRVAKEALDTGAFSGGFDIMKKFQKKLLKNQKKPDPDKKSSDKTK